jgi:hypothetical protein
VSIEQSQAALVTPAEGLTGTQDPWTRQARESDLQHLWFMYFRDSAYPEGPGGRFTPRSLAGVAEDLGQPLSAVQGLAESFAWVVRAAAWDKLVDARRLDAQLTEVDKQRAKHSRTWDLLWTGLENETAKLVQQMLGPAPVLKPRELESLLKSATELMRLLKGEAGSIVEVKDPHDYSQLSEEELWTFRALQEKAKGG